MDQISNPTFRESILQIAQAYGDPGFWLQNLKPDMNPDATWRTLLVLGSINGVHYEKEIRPFLNHPDSRVRAWACFALGQMKDAAALDEIHAMNADPSNRVRVHAWSAIQAIIGPEGTARDFHISNPTRQNQILISEDSLGFQSQLLELFRDLKFKVHVASTEQETMELALRVKPQVILTDNQKGRDNLSGLNMTWDLCRKSELRETVIFMLTADFVEPVFLWSGGDYFLSKANLDLDGLLRTVVEYLHY